MDLWAPQMIADFFGNDVLLDAEQFYHYDNSGSEEGERETNFYRYFCQPLYWYSYCSVVFARARVGVHACECVRVLTRRMEIILKLESLIIIEEMVVIDKEICNIDPI